MANVYMRRILDITQTLLGLLIIGVIVILLFLVMWVLSGPRISQSYYDGNGGVIIVCGSLYSTENWLLSLICMFAVPALALILLIRMHRHCTQKLELMNHYCKKNSLRNV